MAKNRNDAGGDASKPILPPLPPERAIERFDEDVLDRREFVRRLSRTLIDETTGRSTGVVIGITGSWGSGKSSILNLLHQYVTSDKHHPKAIVVRFDPWLVSGRDDLVGQFFVELVSSVKKAPGLKEKGEKLAQAFASYGAHLAPLADLVAPGLGSIFGGGLKALEDLLERDQGLHRQRADIRALLKDIESPIIVFIDELDRIEDHEVRTVAQLVRAVADFRGISYVLAYDAERVIGALGGQTSAQTDIKRGRLYLEKIVQFQFPLPVIFDGELHHLLETTIARSASNAAISDAWNNDKRLRDLLAIVIPGMISTPRDVARLAGSFQVLEPMLRGEVDWRDLLGYCVLLVKAPETGERLKKEPDLVCDLQATESAMLLRLGWEKKGLAERVADIAVENESSPELAKLLAFLFPCFSYGIAANRPMENNNPDAIWRRAALLTTLRLGLIPGRFSRRQIAETLRFPQTKMEEFFHGAMADGALTPFTDRLVEIFHEIDGVDHMTVWLAFANAFKKPDSNWLQSHTPMGSWAHSVASLMDDLISRGCYRPSDAVEYFNALIASDDVTISSLLLREHLFQHNLFGRRKTREGSTFLDKQRVEEIVLGLSRRYRRAHLDGQWMASLWHLTPVYAMVDTKIWDDQCRERLKNLLADDLAVVGLALMLYSSGTSTSQEMVDAIVGQDYFRERVRALCQPTAIERLHASAKVALERTIRGAI